MPRFCIIFRYVGTDYHGFQTQPGRTTVQETLEQAFFHILREPVRITPSGRTDAGVHALAQVAHFDCTTGVALERLQDAAIVYKVNSVLPESIALINLRSCAPDFHARQSAVRKTYAYWILQARQPDPFFINRAWHIANPLNFEGMRLAAASLIGKHDFTTFCASDSNAIEKTRDLMSIKFDTNPPNSFFTHGQQNWLCVEFTGNGFLKQMVRNMMGTLVEVGRGQRSPESLSSALAARDRTLAGQTAPACGLYLKQVDYA